MGLTWLWTASVRACRRASWARADSWTAGLTLSGGLSLLSVAAVLVVVSVPRLRSLALRENEADARATAQLLARSLSTLPAREGRTPTVAECASRPEPVSLADTEILEGGALLRRHGYLFEVTRLPARLSSSGSAAPSPLGLRAWPWAHGRTGVAAFVVTADGTTWEHANEPRRWDGLAARAQEPADDEGWRGDL